MINPTNHLLNDEISELEAKMFTIDPKVGLEKVKNISTGILTQLHSAHGCTLSRTFTIQLLLKRVSILQTHFNERAIAALALKEIMNVQV